jgi:hypothetical protein
MSQVPNTSEVWSEIHEQVELGETNIEFPPSFIKTVDDVKYILSAVPQFPDYKGYFDRWPFKQNPLYYVDMVCSESQLSIYDALTKIWTITTGWATEDATTPVLSVEPSKVEEVIEKSDDCKELLESLLINFPCTVVTIIKELIWTPNTSSTIYTINMILREKEETINLTLSGTIERIKEQLDLLIVEYEEYYK